MASGKKACRELPAASLGTGGNILLTRLPRERHGKLRDVAAVDVGERRIFEAAGIAAVGRPVDRFLLRAKRRREEYYEGKQSTEHEAGAGAE
jgi:hypothetical protein